MKIAKRVLALLIVAALAFGGYTVLQIQRSMKHSNVVVEVM